MNWTNPKAKEGEVPTVEQNGGKEGGICPRRDSTCHRGRMEDATPLKRGQTDW